MSYIYFPVSEINKKPCQKSLYDVVACVIIVRHKHLQHKIYNYFKSLNNLNVFLYIQNVIRVNFNQRNFLRKREFLCYKNPFSVFYE